MRAALLLAALAGAAARLTKAPPTVPAIHVRGGGIFGRVARDAIEASSIQERTDAIATPLAATRTAVGAMLLFASFAVYCCCCRKRRNKAQPEIFDPAIDDNKDTPQQDPELGDGLEDPVAKNDLQVDYLPDLA